MVVKPNTVTSEVDVIQKELENNVVIESQQESQESNVQTISTHTSSSIPPPPPPPRTLSGSGSFQNLVQNDITYTPEPPEPPITPTRGGRNYVLNEENVDVEIISTSSKSISSSPMTPIGAKKVAQNEPLQYEYVDQEPPRASLVSKITDNTPKCALCTKSVYPAEKVQAINRIWHVSTLSKINIV